VPRETDAHRIQLLISLLRDPASNVVDFSQGAERGLEALLPRRWAWSLAQKHARLKKALLDYLASGKHPNRVEYAGRADLDPGVFHEFRLVLRGVGLYIKTEIREGRTPEDATLRIVSVRALDGRAD
jgi:hypothetical protein